MLDAHAYAMQVKLCKANTRGVTFVAPVRETKENDATWTTKERDFESQKISYGF